MTTIHPRTVNPHTAHPRTVDTDGPLAAERRRSGGAPPAAASGPTELLSVADAAIARIAPVWPLKDFVAVNPYLGLADLPFDVAAHRLSVSSGISTTMPVDYYLDQLNAGRLDHDDLRAVLSSGGWDRSDADVVLREAEVAPSQVTPAVVTLAEVAGLHAGIDVQGVVLDRVSSWAAAHLDEGQAQWAPRDRTGLYAAWRREALVDRTPDVAGLRGARHHLAELPEDPDAALVDALIALDLDASPLELYLDRVLRRLGGWSATLAHQVWQANLAGSTSTVLREWLAVLLGWELVAARVVGEHEVLEDWRRRVRTVSAEPPTTHRPALVLHEALERAERRRLVGSLAAAVGTHRAEGERGRPSAQLVFCIDVRSEVIRRHLERIAPELQTLGFAGFFGMPVAFTPLAHDDVVAQCPVLLSPAQTVREVVGDDAATRRAADRRTRTHQVTAAWKSFKMGAVSCFSFVGPVGLAYLPKLFSDGFGRTAPVRNAGVEGLPRSCRDSTIRTVDLGGIGLDERVDLAEGALRGMSLTQGFGRLVVLVAHGATSTNNPHASGLDCGACGGHGGEVNARVAAAVLNDPDVRNALRERGIDLPEDTLALAARHDTTTDAVDLFAGDVPPSHRADVEALAALLGAAGRAVRTERAARIGVAADDLPARAGDWAQVRPEWGLAGCQAFVAAPRERTAGLDLGGRAFLHSYDWRQDEGFAVLEQIMTAPMVVASWISLQYFASTVDNDAFGAGNKTLHNVVGRLGVLEGTSGDLRTGLPWQSLHDGEQLQHVPVRLSVLIEAPTEAIDAVLASNPGVDDLVRNEWIHLHSIGDDGTVLHRTRHGWEVAAG